MAYMNQGGLWLLKQPATAVAKNIYVLTGFKPFVVRTISMTTGVNSISVRGYGASDFGVSQAATGAATPNAADLVTFKDNYFILLGNATNIRVAGGTILVECWTDDYQARDPDDARQGHQIKVDELEEWKDPANSHNLFDYDGEDRAEGKYPAIGNVYIEP